MPARPDQIYDLLAPARGSDIDVIQGFLTAWNGTTYANTVTVNGASLTDLPLIGSSDPALLSANTVVAILKVRATYYILGRITTP